MSTCLPDPKKNCPPVDPVDPPVVYEGFSLCVGNKTLTYDGKGFVVTDRTFQIPDGTYSKITYSGGCVVGVGQAGVAAYTPNACCAEGTSGGDNGSGIGPDVVVDPSANNWLTNGAAGLLVAPNIVAGSGIDIVGQGTPANPLEISFSETPHDGSISAQTLTPDQLTVSGDGRTGTPLQISFKAIGMGSGTYGGFGVNAFGQVISYTAPASVKQLLAGAGVSLAEVPPGSGIWQITASGGGGTITIPGVTAGVGINITESPVGSSNYTVAIDKGAVAGTFTTNDGKTVTYTTNGFIQSVV